MPEIERSAAEAFRGSSQDAIADDAVAPVEFYAPLQREGLVLVADDRGELIGFVACEASFTDQPEVINGASDLMVQVFGDAGRHARFAVGANVLPRNVATEVEAIFELA